MYLSLYRLLCPQPPISDYQTAVDAVVQEVHEYQSIGRYIGRLGANHHSYDDVQFQSYRQDVNFQTYKHGVSGRGVVDTGEFYRGLLTSGRPLRNLGYHPPVHFPHKEAGYGQGPLPVGRARLEHHSQARVGNLLTRENEPVPFQK